METNPAQGQSAAGSSRYDAWRSVLPVDPRQRWDEDTLNKLCETAPAAEVLYELVTFINSQFFAARQKPWFREMGLEGWGSDCAAKLQPRVEAARKQLGWRQRYVDLQVLRELRRETKLCLTIGAGVTIDAGGPSWPQLVRLLINIALRQEHEIARILPDPDGELGDKRYIKEVVPVPPLEARERGELKEILGHIEEKGADSDTKRLMRAAEICYKLFGQQLLKHLTTILYAHSPRPGPIHRAIAEVARNPRRSLKWGVWPAWGSIINYNFDGLLFDAFNEAGVPQLIGLTKADQQLVWYKFPEIECEWWQPVLHLHGFTPSWRMDITLNKFVLSESQYAETYRTPVTKMIKTLREQILARPPIVCLYVGCSFSDEAMNELLTEAWDDLGHIHYALLQWPEDRKGREPTWEEIETNSSRYKVMGIQPIWFDDFREIPDIIRNLQ